MPAVRTFDPAAVRVVKVPVVEETVVAIRVVPVAVVKTSPPVQVPPARGR